MESMADNTSVLTQLYSCNDKKATHCNNQRKEQTDYKSAYNYLYERLEIEMSRLGELLNNFGYVLKEEGIHYAVDRVKVHASDFRSNVVRRHSEIHDDSSDFVDVLFINGCDYAVPHPIRYRVDHQIEQLEYAGLSTRKVDSWFLTEDHARLARVFVIFRCPYTEAIGHFIEVAHELGRPVFFDIDDLVFDTKYTDTIPFLASLSKRDRFGYDEGVRLMGKTLGLCDGAISTTEQLVSELNQTTDIVFLNRNVASQEMVRLSERAMFERDQLPLLPYEEVRREDLHRWRLAQKRRASADGFHIGYFSGSNSHIDDLLMIMPALLRFLDSNPDVYFHVVGEIDLPAEFDCYANRIVRIPFSSWRRLPKLISNVDINLVPLVDSVFNRAKSENKWVEASLVKVPTIASDIGALHDSIEQNETGILCRSIDDWFEALSFAKNNPEPMKTMAERAYSECVSRHTTCGTGVPLASFLRSQMRPNIAFVLPALILGGGVLVALKHAALMRQAGYDVTLYGRTPKEDGLWYSFEETRFPVLSYHGSGPRGRFDKMVCTMWSTMRFVALYRNAGKKYYLVQGMETDFYSPDDPLRVQASETYGMHPEFTYCTVSPWCKKWLSENYGHEARFSANGIDLSMFYWTKRDWSGKIRILIEGDPASDYKNVDEAFRISEKLDQDRFEIWLMSYNGEPKGWYRTDRFLHKVPHEKVAGVCRQCHILLKTSLLESFSYPPLEMMATGGMVVAIQNDGNSSYLRHGENCLLFQSGEDDLAVQHIETITHDSDLRDQLERGGLQTAQEYDWGTVKDSILEMYR